MCYKTCNLFYDLKVLLFRKIGETPLSKNKIQKMSPIFVHFMYLIFERILLKRKFWGMPLRCNDDIKLIQLKVFGLKIN